MGAARSLLRVGLTGGIASGKSHVRARLAAAGCATVDLDRVSHELMQAGGAAVGPVVDAFGAGVLGPDGGIDRKALGATVFASAPERRRLEAIVHPLVRAREAALAAEAAAQGARLFVTDAALLVESGTHLRFDRLLVSHCGEEAQLERLRARDGLSEAAARARLAAQMPSAEKRRFADVVIDTAGSIAHTDEQVAEAAAALRATPAPLPLGLPLERAAGALREGPPHGPRGLTPARLLAAATAAGGLELPALARALTPPFAGPWLEAAEGEAEGPGPEALAGALVVWCAARGADGPIVLAAAASLARLTHRAPAAIAGAVVSALALWDVARRGRVDTLASGALQEWAGAARARAGAPPPPALLDELAAAGRGQAGPGTVGGAAAGLCRGAALGTDALSSVLRGLALAAAQPRA